ncbi:MAG TPA: SAF domain-containing protein [Acidimicrobiales bacterium]|nr:SAF domain-containing protein [Acidimicrobiales bacterium]
MSTVLMTIAVRGRRLALRPSVRRLAVGALALVTATAVLAAASAAESARTRWGATRPVVVATRDLAPGDRVTPGAVTTRDLPATLVPDAALAASPRAAVVRQPILAGEPIVPTRLTPQGLTGVAALVPEGRRAVAIPRGPAGLPPLAVGDDVDVVAVSASMTGADPLAVPDPAAAPPACASPSDDVPPPAAGDDPPAAADACPPTPPAPSPPDPATAAAQPAPERAPPAATLVERALVVDVGQDAVTVAVPAADAPRVAWALANGAVVLALAGR